jgi:membrane protein
VWSLVKETAANWVAHRDARLGAALSYYSIFSVGPLIVIAISIAGVLFGEDAVRGEVSAQVQGLLGNSGAQAIQSMLVGAARPHEGAIAALFGIVTLIFAALGVVVQLKDALNTVWEVEAKKSGVWSFVCTYLVSLAGVLALGFLLLVSLLVSAFLAAGSKYVAPYLPEVALQLISSLVSLAFITLLFAMMFKWLPDADVAWSDVWVGAAVTAVLFEVGKLLIGLYIGKQGLESTFGAAASLVVLLIWIYYSSQIVLMGAEFTRAYARSRGAHAFGARSAAPSEAVMEAPPQMLGAIARRSPFVLILLSAAAGWALSRPGVQRLIGIDNDRTRDEFRAANRI